MQVSLLCPESEYEPQICMIALNLQSIPERALEIKIKLEIEARSEEREVDCLRRVPKNIQTIHVHSQSLSRRLKN